MFAKFAYDPGDVRRVEMDVEPALAVARSTALGLWLWLEFTRSTPEY